MPRPSARSKSEQELTTCGLLGALTAVLIGAGDVDDESIETLNNRIKALWTAFSERNPFNLNTHGANKKDRLTSHRSICIVLSLLPLCLSLPNSPLFYWTLNQTTNVFSGLLPRATTATRKVETMQEKTQLTEERRNTAAERVNPWGLLSPENFFSAAAVFPDTSSSCQKLNKCQLKIPQENHICHHAVWSWLGTGPYDPPQCCSSPANTKRSCKKKKKKKKKKKRQKSIFEGSVFSSGTFWTISFASQQLPWTSANLQDFWRVLIHPVRAYPRAVCDSGVPTLDPGRPESSFCHQWAVPPCWLLSLWLGLEIGSAFPGREQALLCLVKRMKIM